MGIKGGLTIAAPPVICLSTKEEVITVKHNLSGSLLVVLLLLVTAALVVAQEAPERPWVVATDYPSIQDAIWALPENGGTVYIPAGTYVITETIDLTGRTTIPRSEQWPHGNARVVLQGAGHATRLIGRTDGQPVIDLTFSGYCMVRDLSIVGDNCNVGILLAREKPNGGSAGGNIFQNLGLEGRYSVATVYSMGSECNRFYNCWFYNNVPGATVFYSTPRNPAGVESPYVPGAGGGCNTDLKLYGCVIVNRGEGSVGLRIEAYSNEVVIYGGYFSNQGFAAIYLDGTEACLDGITIKQLRIEGEGGKHCLYTTGITRNCRIEGGSWGSGWGEVIYQAPPEAGQRMGTQAQAWHIESLCAYLNVGHSRAQGQEEGPVYDMGDEDFYVLTRFHKVTGSNIDLRYFVVPVYWEPGAGEDFKFHYAQNIKALVVEEQSAGNVITVPRREHVAFKGEVSATSVLALNEQGTQRWYLGQSLLGAVLNLAPTDPATVENPKPGDLLLDENYRLGVWDGEQWRFFQPVQE